MHYIEWSGRDWQLYILQLLKRYHRAPDLFQEIPDKVHGDWGLEGYSCSGFAYQCYAPQDKFLSTKQLYENQRKKITDDIRKFIDNKTELSNLFVTTKISKWIFVIPRFDNKDLLKHTAKKEQEVRAANLPYVTSDFGICVVTDDHFSIERNELLSQRILEPNIEIDEVKQESVEEWADGHSKLISQLDGKIDKIKVLKTKNEKIEFRNRILVHYLEGQNVIEQIRQQSADLYINIRKIKENKEKFLQTNCLLTTSAPNEVLLSELEKYQTDLKKQVNLTDGTAEYLAYEAVSDWLLRCPLKFI